MTGIEAILAAEPHTGNSTLQSSQDIPSVFSQEEVANETQPSSMVTASYSQVQAQSSQSMSIQPQPLLSQPQVPQEATKRYSGELSLQVPPSTQAIAGQKRTVDGHVRRSFSASSRSSQENDPDPKRRVGHSRNTSTASSAMSPRELTSELKTRLSYAMMKVQKGWESLPIYEVESLASQSGSPKSSTSGVNGRPSELTSPRVALAHHQDGDVAIGDAGNGEAQIEGQKNNERTYESFWRSQTQRTYASPQHQQVQSSSQPVADYSPRMRQNGGFLPRRTSLKGTQHRLGLGGLCHSTSDLSQYSTSSSGTTTVPPPHTPREDSLSGAHTPVPASAAPASHNDNLHTPHEPSRGQANSGRESGQTKTQSMQEQDAIETLLFMSSPGQAILNNFSSSQPNPSGHRLSQTSAPNNHISASQPLSQGSPLKSEFASYREQFREDPESGRPYGGSRANYNNLLRRTEQRRSTSTSSGVRDEARMERIDRLIDSYKEESSDEEVEIPIPQRPVEMPTSAGSGA